jgi:hypothetical protein
MRARVWFFVACAAVAACDAFATDDARTADAGPLPETGTDAATATTTSCPPASLYCLDFDGPPRGTYASAELETQTPVASGAVVAAPISTKGGGNGARFVLPASANDFTEFAAQTFVLPVTDDVQIEADLLIDDPHMSLSGNALSLLIAAADDLGDSRAEAKIDGSSDGTVHVDLYTRESAGGSPGGPTVDDKTKVGIPFGSWVHVTLRARLAGTKSDAGMNAVITDRGAQLVREMARNPKATRTSFVFGIGKSVPTPVDIAVTFDNVTVTKLP